MTLEEMKRIADARTKEQWQFERLPPDPDTEYEYGPSYELRLGDYCIHDTTYYPSAPTLEDAAFIAMAANNWDNLVERLEQAEARNTVVEKIKRIQEVVDAQAEAEGIWSHATTIHEAYLQNELRRLHREIETNK